MADKAFPIGVTLTYSNALKLLGDDGTKAGDVNATMFANTSQLQTALDSINSLSSTVSTQGSAINTQSGQIITVTAVASTHTTQINTLTTNLTAANTNISNLTANVASLSTSVTTNTTNITNLNTAVGTKLSEPQARALVQEFTTVTSARNVDTADHGKLLLCTNTSDIILTLPSSLPLGTIISVRAMTANKVTFAAGAGATLVCYPAAQYSTAGQYSTITAILQPSNVWHVTGQTAA